MFTLLPPATAQELQIQEASEAYSAYLQELEGSTTNINSASQVDLQALPGITPDLAWRITVFRPFQKVQDVSRIPGMTPDLFEQILPYLSIKDHRHWQGHLTTRLTRPTNNPNKLSHLRVTQRAEIQWGEHITGFVLTDRDPQEPTWADYLTAHLQIKYKWGQIVLGDVRPEIGQGLLHSRQTRSSANLSAIRPRSHHHITNRSSTEFGALRGVHLTTRSGAWTLQAFFGETKWDATISPEGAAQIRRTELHVSQTTQERKNNLRERIGTLHVALGTPENHLGATVQKLTFSPTRPQGIGTTNLSINGRSRWHQTTFFAEWAQASHANAFIAGINWQKETLRLSLLARHYAPTYGALHGAPIAAYGAPPKNEQGFFFGFVYRPAPKTRLIFSLDRHRNLVPENKAMPNQGHRFRLGLHHRLHPKIHLQITHNTRKTRYTAKRIENRVTWKLSHRATQTTTWLANTKVANTSKGYATGARCQIGQTFRLAMWTTYYHIPTYSARIYDFEPDVWGSGTLQTRSGKGQSWGILLAWRAQNFRLATRFSKRKTNQQPASSWAIQGEIYH